MNNLKYYNFYNTVVNDKDNYTYMDNYNILFVNLSNSDMVYLILYTFVIYYIK